MDHDKATVLPGEPINLRRRAHVAPDAEKMQRLQARMESHCTSLQSRQEQELAIFQQNRIQLSTQLSNRSSTGLAAAAGCAMVLAFSIQEWRQASTRRSSATWMAPSHSYQPDRAAMAYGLCGNSSIYDAETHVDEHVGSWNSVFILLEANGSLRHRT